MKSDHAPAPSGLPRFLSAFENARANEWWEFKIPPLLATAYATSLVLHIPVEQLWPVLLLILFALLPGAAYVCVINDITDIDEDRKAGKKNRMEGKSRGFQIVALMVCILPGLVVGWLLRHDPVTLPLYATTWLAYTFYSVRPVRLKTRGIGGVLMDASGAHLLPTLWTATLVAEATGHDIPWQFLGTLGVWALAYGLRGILWHQLYDLENDRKVHVTTFAATKNSETIRNFVRWGTFPVEMAALVLILIQVGTFWTWPLLGIYLAGEWLAHRLLQIDVVLVQATGRYRIAFAEYYQLQYPLTFLLAMTQVSLAAAWLIALHLVLFPHCFCVFLAQVRYFFALRIGPGLARRIKATIAHVKPSR